MPNPTEERPRQLPPIRMDRFGLVLLLFAGFSLPASAAENSRGEQLTIAVIDYANDGFRGIFNGHGDALSLIQPWAALDQNSNGRGEELIQINAATPQNGTAIEPGWELY